LDETAILTVTPKISEAATCRTIPLIYFGLRRGEGAGEAPLALVGVVAAVGDGVFSAIIRIAKDVLIQEIVSRGIRVGP
jgi:hypothetical protein